MVVDSSSLIAIFFGEDGFELYSTKLEQAVRPVISAATLVETQMVVTGRRGEEGLKRFRAFFLAFSIEVVPFTQSQVELASDGFIQFGRGRHPAALNLGDCYAYALAKETGLPLLFKGNDFSQTDIPSA